ncbi:hypothetical protein SCE1572_46830 [Sorangium cellulosum So0157-2]|uniref:Uncharacterized protein n=1 Tax=Sorangium cellulosum So0157-2 TaxID=1254432 RepID=S4Y8Z3_SORCE|nr:hypothetical protein SCE1572_46830 [Sorangium cellulosum So0157-2]
MHVDAQGAEDGEEDQRDDEEAHGGLCGAGGTEA